LRKWKLNTVVSLIVLAAFMAVAGVRLFREHPTIANHVLNRATVDDHSASFDSPSLTIAAHTAPATIMPVCSYVESADIQAHSFVYTSRDYIRPPPAHLA
jgi:hypothetical protein